MKVTDKEVAEIYDKDPDDHAVGDVYDLFKDDHKTFYSYTGFSINEFEQLHDSVKECLTHHGRGRKSKHGSKDLLFIFLFYFRRYPRIETINTLFKIPESSFKDLLGKYGPLLADCLEQKYIIDLRQNCRIIYDQDFPECGYIVDATVQPIEVGHRSHESIKDLFSGKHWIYCIKSQVIVTLEGLAVHIVTDIAGGVHDKRIFDDNLKDFREQVLQYHTNDPAKIMGDKGYQDQSSPILVTPYKGDINSLDDEQLEFNQKLGKIRVIVENYFGRLKIRYQICKDRFRSDRSLYKMYFRICCSLINFELSQCNHPLRQTDSSYYTKFMTKMIKEAKRQRAYIRRRRRYLKKKREGKILEDPEETKYDSISSSSSDSDKIKSSSSYDIDE